ncbi:MAG: ABC transporter permease [Verrucomicrobiia bacterium]
MLSFVIATPQPGKTPSEVANNIEKETGLKAFTEDNFFWATIHWYIKNTGIPVAFGMTIILGFIVGVAVCGQTFYSFILDNLRNLGAFKAMGASDRMLATMVIMQALAVGFLGYRCGLGLAALFGFSVLEKGQPPFYMPQILPLATLLAILMICVFAALLGIRKIRKLEPAIVFRG